MRESTSERSFVAAAAVQLVVAVLVIGAVGVGSAVAATQLAAVDVDTPEQVAPGDTVTVTYTVENTGQATQGYVLDPTLPGTWSVGNYTGNGTWQGGDKVAYPALEPGETVTPTLEVSVPDDASLDEYHVSGQVSTTDDGGTTVTESAASTVEVWSSARFVTLEDDGTHTISPDGTSSIGYTLENTGDEPRGVILTASVPSGWSAVGHDGNGTWQGHGKVAYASLAPGEVVTPEIDVSAPASADGTGTVDATAAFTYQDRTENASTETMVDVRTGGTGGAGGGPSSGSASISVTDASVSPNSIAPGESVDVRIDLANDGNGEGVSTLSLQADGEEVDSLNVVVGADASRSASLSYPFQEAGTYDLSVNGESAGTVTVAEASEEPTETESTDTETPAGSDDGDEVTEMPLSDPTPSPDGDDSTTTSGNGSLGAPVLIGAGLLVVAILSRRAGQSP